MRTSLNLTSTHGSMCADERRSTHQFLAPVIDTHWWRQVTGIVIHCTEASTQYGVLSMGYWLLGLGSWV